MVSLANLGLKGVFSNLLIGVGMANYSWLCYDKEVIFEKNYTHYCNLLLSMMHIFGFILWILY